MPVHFPLNFKSAFSFRGLPPPPHLQDQALCTWPHWGQAGEPSSLAVLVRL